MCIYIYIYRERERERDRYRYRYRYRYIHVCSSRVFKAQGFEARGSSPRVAAYVGLETPFEGSKLPGSFYDY